MLHLSQLKIALLSSVPCSAIGVTAYYGYQNTNYNVEEVEPLPTIDALTSKHLRIKNLKESLSIKTSLLSNEVKEKDKLEAELTFLDVVSLKKKRANLDIKSKRYFDSKGDVADNERFVGDEIKKRDAALEAKKQKQNLFDEKVKALDQNKQSQEAKQQEATRALNNLQGLYQTLETIRIQCNQQEDKKRAATHHLTTNQNQIQQYQKAINSKKALLNQALEHLIVEDHGSLMPTPDLTDSSTLPLLKPLNTHEMDTSFEDDLIKEATNASESYKKTIKEAEAKISELTPQKQDAQQKADEANRKYGEIQQSINTLETEEEKLKREKEKLEKDLSRAESTLKTVQTALTLYQTRTEFLNTKYQESKKDIEDIVGPIVVDSLNPPGLLKKEADLDKEIRDKARSLDSSKITISEHELTSLEQIEELIKSHKVNLDSKTKTIETLNAEVASINSEISLEGNMLTENQTIH